MQKGKNLTHFLVDLNLQYIILYFNNYINSFICKHKYCPIECIKFTTLEIAKNEKKYSYSSN